VANGLPVMRSAAKAKTLQATMKIKAEILIKTLLPIITA